METIRASGLGQQLSDALTPWRIPTAIHDLAKDASKSLAAIDTARARARGQVWGLAGEHAPAMGPTPRRR